MGLGPGGIGEGVGSGGKGVWSGVPGHVPCAVPLSSHVLLFLPFRLGDGDAAGEGDDDAADAK